jgi:hypothetical protein
MWIFMWTHSYRYYKTNKETDLQMCDTCRRLLDPEDTMVRVPFWLSSNVCEYMLRDRYFDIIWEIISTQDIDKIRNLNCKQVKFILDHEL